MKRMIDEKLIEKIASISEAELSQLSTLLENIDIWEDGSIEFEEGIVIPSIANLVNSDGDSFFPPLTDQNGKVVVVKDDVFEYQPIGTKLYKHTINAEINSNQKTLIVVCPTSSAFTGSIQQVLDNLFNDGSLLFLSLYGEKSNCLYDYDNSEINYVVSGAIQSLAIVETDTITSDTVIPL